jgi:hypothetical protein
VTVIPSQAAPRTDEQAAAAKTPDVRIEGAVRMTTQKVEAQALDEKALASFHKELSSHIEHGDNAYRSAIRAYLSSLPEAPAVPGVKALEWKQNSQNIENSLWANVETIGRTYTIEPESHVFRVETQITLSEYGPDAIGLYPTLDAAKAAAQFHFAAIVGPLQSSPPVKAAAADGPVMKALHIGQAYVLDAMRNDGGIENCEIGYRTDFETISKGIAALASRHAVEGEAVAWMHTLHMEGGQTAVRLARAEVDRPWGKPGIDFDQAYSVTITPLYPRPAAADAGVREALRSALRDLVNACDVDAPLYTDDDDDKPVMTAARKALNLACRSLAAKREQGE